VNTPRRFSRCSRSRTTVDRLHRLRVHNVVSTAKNKINTTTFIDNPVNNCIFLYQLGYIKAILIIFKLYRCVCVRRFTGYTTSSVNDVSSRRPRICYTSAFRWTTRWSFRRWRGKTSHVRTIVYCIPTTLIMRVLSCQIMVFSWQLCCQITVMSCCLSRCFQQSNVSQNVVYSQNNMLLAAKLVIFVICDFSR